MALHLSLEHLTAWGLAPLEFIDLAADLGCEAVSLFVLAPMPSEPAPAFVEDRGLLRACRQRLDDRGVRLNALEVFPLAQDTRVADFEAGLEAGAELGGRMATVIVFDPDRARVIDRLGAFAELARRFGIVANVEFIARSELRSLPDAISLVRAVGAPGLGIVVDSLHWTRSGGTAAQLAALDPALLGHVQFCDGPAQMALELQLEHEGFRQRRIPGEGEFALADFVGALPGGRLIGVEVPLADLARRGVPIQERARRAVAGARQVLECEGYDRQG